MGKKILIVDDEQEYLAAIKKFLSEFGYSISDAVYSRQALEIIKIERPDLVLFDYKMPDMDGEEFFKKAKELMPSIPYFLITAWNEASILERFRKLGVNEVMLKPVNLEELLKKIQANKI